MNIEGHCSSGGLNSFITLVVSCFILFFLFCILTLLAYHNFC